MVNRACRIVTRLLPIRERARLAGHHFIREGLPAFPADDPAVPESPRRLLLIRGVALLALALTLGYLVWRACFTLNADAWWISIPVLLLEIHAFIGLALFTFSLWDAHALPPARVVTSTHGRIAVLIPTYNEGIDVLLPTIAAAVALEPAHQTWVLDDGHRPEVGELARSLGADWLTRPDNQHAKAGNINHALGVIDADYIAVLDADHVAAPDFLTHTLGYFDDPDVALVQTPQDFYNIRSFEHAALPDDISGNHRRLYHEQALFYRVIQPCKNRWGAAFWCGTNAVARVAAIQDVGGIAVDTITEDIHTTIRLHQRGWKTVYHNEVLARGLAAASADQYQAQRLRWGVGAMQVLRLDNPFWTRGLSLGQRLAYLTTLLGWFDAWRSLGYLLVPPIVLFTGAVPIKADALTFLTVFLSVFLLQRCALRLLSRGYFDDTLQTVFELVRMAPNLRATLALVRRKPARFQVTPKGRVGDARRLTPAPRLLLAALSISAASAAWFALTVAGVTPLTYAVPASAYGAFFWLAVNSWFVCLAIRRIRAEAFGAERRCGIRFETALAGNLGLDPCQVLDVSLSGARVSGGTLLLLGDEVELTVDPDRLDLQFQVVVRSRYMNRAGDMTYGLSFVGMQFRERARAALALFNAQIALSIETPLALEAQAAVEALAAD